MGSSQDGSHLPRNYWSVETGQVIYIKPQHQNLGIGASVLQAVYKKAASLALPIRVGALKESASNRFYERHGFQLVEQSEFDNYYIRGEPQQAKRHE